jgi:hypothetical protein
MFLEDEISLGVGDVDRDKKRAHGRHKIVARKYGEQD